VKPRHGNIRSYNREKYRKSNERKSHTDKKWNITYDERMENTYDERMEKTYVFVICQSDRTQKKEENKIYMI